MHAEAESNDDLYITPPDGWVRSISFGTSLLMHLSALALLAALVMPMPSGAGQHVIQGGLIDTLLGDEGGFPGEEIAFFENAGGGLSLSQIDLPAVAPSQEMNLMALEMDSSPAEMQLAAPDLASDADLGLTTANSNGKSGGGSGKGSGSAGKGKGSGKGNSTGAGTGGRGKGGFFGLKVKGKSTVFVVDASRSMNLPHPGPLRTRFNRVKYELIRAINSMEEDDRFFVIFFSDVAYPMPADRMMEATAGVRRRYLQWISHQQPSSQTFPETALMLALSLEADQIYFLTDGEFDYSVVPGVTKANRVGTAIHCIGFSDNRGENMLLEMARRNNGTYTYIPPDESEEDLGIDGNKAISIIAPLGK